MDNLNLNETLQAWADITIDRWQAKIEKLRISDTMSLENSFTAELISEGGGNVQRIEFAFNLYGRFVDMGVGAGVGIDQVKLLTTDRRLEGAGDGNRRRSRRWYSRTLYAERERLSEILADKYGRKAAIGIVEALQIDVVGL